MEWTPETIVPVVVGVVTIIVVAVLVRRRTSVSYEDGKRRIKLDASDPPDPPGPKAVVRDATSERGGAVAEDGTGTGALLERVTVKDDLVARVTGAAGSDSDSDSEKKKDGR